MPKSPISIRGVTYPSITTAALALGLATNSIYRAKKLGKLDSVGLYYNGGRPQPVTIDGIEYPSISKASRETGIPYHKLVAANKTRIFKLRTRRIRPPHNKTVLVAGGTARYINGTWYSGAEEPLYTRPLEWWPNWWAEIPTEND